MVMYDESYVAAYRAKAVTDVKDFVVGRTYYGRLSPEPFVLKEIITHRQHYINQGLTVQEDSEADKLRWFIDDRGTVDSLWDSNIGASYNPWLIFADKATAEEYFSGLELRFDTDPYEVIIDPYETLNFYDPLDYPLDEYDFFDGEYEIPYDSKD